MRLYLLVLGVVLAGEAFAEPKQTKEEFCKGQSVIAAVIMKTRQAGAPMSEMMDIAAKYDDPALKSLTVMAYESPAFQTESMKEKAVSDFENRAYLECYKALKKIK